MQVHSLQFFIPASRRVHELGARKIFNEDVVEDEYG